MAESLDPAWAEPSLERGWISIEAGRLEHGTTRVVAVAPALAYAERALAILREHAPADTTSRANALYLRGLARIEAATAVQTYRNEDQSLLDGRRDLDSAVMLDNSLAGAWAALSKTRWLTGDFEGAEQAATRALAADAFLQDGDEVISWAWRSAYARADRQKALQWCHRGRELLPADWHFIECELTLMRLDAAHLTSTTPEPRLAWSLVAQLEHLDPPSQAAQAGRPYSPIYRRLVAAAVSAAAGQTDSARAVLRRELAAVRDDPELSTDILYDGAFLNLVLGDLDQAREMISRYLRARPDLSTLLKRDPTLRPVFNPPEQNRAHIASSCSTDSSRSDDCESRLPWTAARMWAAGPSAASSSTELGRCIIATTSASVANLSRIASDSLSPNTLA
jgi:tetratricopeptide (TPR) repeat protein